MKELDSILKNIKNKELQPLYFFHGEEPYFIDTVVRSFENDVLEEDEKAFGQTVVYGKDTTVAEIVSLAQQFPMFGNRNLIIVKEAHDLKLNEEERTILENYAASPVPSTIVVFAYKKKFPGNTKLAKVLQKSGMLYYSEPVRDYNVPKWIADHFKTLKILAAPNISHLLAEYLGTDLSRISNELQKLKMLLKDGEILDEKMVERHIGISKEYNIFELQRALATRDAARSMKIVHYMGKNMKVEPLPKILGSLYTFFSNVIIYQTLAGENQQTMAAEMGVAPFALKDYAAAARLYPYKYATRIISFLRETDLKSKGLGAHLAKDEELLQELAYKILNVDRLKVKL